MRVQDYLREHLFKNTYDFAFENYNKYAMYHEYLYLGPKVTLHCVCIYLLGVFMSDIYKKCLIPI